MSEVVNDLREAAEQFHEGSGCEVLLRVAADEIERLRGELETERGHRQADNAESRYEIERMRARVEWFEKSGGVTAHTLVYQARDAARELYRLYLLRGPDSDLLAERWPWLIADAARAAGGGDE